MSLLCNFGFLTFGFRLDFDLMFGFGLVQLWIWFLVNIIWYGFNLPIRYGPSAAFSSNPEPVSTEPRSQKSKEEINQGESTLLIGRNNNIMGCYKHPRWNRRVYRVYSLWYTFQMLRSTLMVHLNTPIMKLYMYKRMQVFFTATIHYTFPTGVQ